MIVHTLGDWSALNIIIQLFQLELCRIDCDCVDLTKPLRNTDRICESHRIDGLCLSDIQIMWFRYCLLIFVIELKFTGKDGSKHLVDTTVTHVHLQ